MSKPISVNSSTTVNLSSYSGCTSEVTAGTGTYAPTVALKSSGTSSSYATFSSSTRNATGYVFYMFDVSEIPKNASITSVSCTARAGVKSTGSGTTRLQLMTGGSTKGNYSGVTSTSTTGETVLLSPTGWTRSELNTIALRIYTVKTRNANGSHIVYFHGATLRVGWEFNGVEYSITISNSSTNATSDPTGQIDIFEGEEQDIKIYTNNIENIKVTDNSNQITPLPSYSYIETSTTFTLTQYDSSNSNASTSSTNMNNGAAGTDSTTYATLYGGRNATNYYYYNFSITGIPQNAIIQQVTLSVKGCRFSAYEWNAALCKNTTEISSVLITASGSSSSTPDTPSIDTLSDNGFNLSDLSNVKLKLKPVNGSSSSRLFFFGANITINYSIPGSDIDYYYYTISNISADHVIEINDKVSQYPYIKINNAWSKYSKVFKKINGSWTEQSDMENVFDANGIYVLKS